MVSYAYSSSVQFEVLGSTTLPARATSVVMEVISKVDAPIHASSVFLEVLAQSFTPKPYVPGIALPWTLRPEWSEGITERLMWLTDVLASQSGVEQRRELRISPRRQVDTPFKVWAEKRRWMDSMLMGQGSGLFHVPVWWEPMRLTAVALLGDNILECNTDFLELAAGDTIMVLGSTPWIYEMGVVHDLPTARDRIVLSTTLAQTWPVGTTVYLTKVARVIGDPEMTRHADNTYEGTINFQITEPNDYPMIPQEDDVTFPLLYLEPAQMDDLTTSYTRLFAEFDNQAGISVRRDLGGQSFNLQKIDFLLHGRKEYAHFRALLYYFGGKLRPFYVTTNMIDAVYLPYATSVATDTHIFIERSGLSEFMGYTTAGRTFLAVFLNDGRAFTAEIAVCTLLSATVEAVVFKTAIGQNFKASDVKRIAYMQLMRQDQDDVEIVHQTDVDGATTCTTTFRTVSSQIRTAGSYFLTYWNGVYTKNADPPAVPIDHSMPVAVSTTTPKLDDSYQGHDTGGDASGGGGDDEAGAGDDGTGGNGASDGGDANSGGGDGAS